ncbi:MAG TPA: MarR family transcriptional regulator [Acidimicrobiales bacterium]|nr:MarR family transcriptional regulator [Acidimicrobiales bacterium]
MPPSTYDPERPRPAGRSGRWPSESDVAEVTGPVVHALFRLSRKNRSMAGEYLRPFGLFPGQELLLLQLPEGACRSQQELVEALGLDHSTVTKMLQRLERAGVVSREQSHEDRRVVMVQLTEQGCAQRRAAEVVWAQLEEATTSCLTDRQRLQLMTLLRKVEAGLD